uniref:CRiSP-Vind1 n=1 Tax=Varanus indicus TaxID=62043 RepID=E2E4F2_VARIN|nr:CRiSP-Vind1 [Varanus indicus]ADK39234.1 CRiSP-Vind2 [Varanus indicus]
MILLKLYLTLAAILLQSHGTTSLELDDLMTTNPDIQNEIINKHNDLRRIVDPPAKNMVKMSWHNTIAESAQRAALRCNYELHTPASERTIDGVECGENYFASSNPRTWSSCIQSWFDERNNFKYGFGPTKSGAMVGHYTQVVWYNSYKVGCAINLCPDQRLKYFQVCQYCPGGNDEDREYEPYAIGEPCAACPNDCDNGLCKIQ